ncbi:MAG: baseplate J/gp47 family protein [Ktedonobacteraceae bacterium]|nr:baseplate J/gp47 family protein [Ktedonobacteraceae bacterium]
MRKDVQDELDDLLRQYNGQHPPVAGASTDDSAERATRLVDVHIYEQGAESEQEPSSDPLQDEQTEASEQQSEQNREYDEASKQQPQARTRVLPASVIGASLALVSAVVLAVVFIILPLLPPVVTVTIIPAAEQVRLTRSVTISQDQHAEPGTIPGRMLAPVSMSQATTVATTGTHHQDAQAAHGPLTFYNAALYAQTVPAGTLLVSKSGVQIVTDQDAIIPAGTFESNGHASVSAHAVSPGPGGNIPAFDLAGPCCLVNILVKNTTAFTGGQDARDYQTARLSIVT